MSKLVIKGQPMTDTFTMLGDMFTKEQYNPVKNTYLYKRVRLDDGRFSCYEVVIPKKVKDENGNILECYPSSSQFGFGRALTTANLNKALQYLDNGCTRIEK